MFKEIKLQAKRLLRENYKTFLPLILVYELFVILNNVAFIVLFEKPLLEPRDLLSVICAFVILLIDLLLLPIITVSVYKVGLSRLQNVNNITFEIKQFLTPNNIFKIAIINLIPAILGLTYTLIKRFDGSFNNKTFYFMLSFGMLIVEYIVSYKLFISNYHFATNESTVKETLKYSANKMKGLFFRYICFGLSFILWDMLIIAIGVVVSFVCGLINVNYDSIAFLFASGYGLMLYYRPYRFLSELFFCQNIAKQHKETVTRLDLNNHRTVL